MNPILARCTKGTSVLLLLAAPCAAQDIVPRRWSHLPIGANFTGAAHAFSTGDNTFSAAFSMMG